MRIEKRAELQASSRSSLHAELKLWQGKRAPAPLCKTNPHTLMKHLLTCASALLVLSACTDAGPDYSGRGRVPADYSLVPAKDAAAVARRSPGFVATPAPKFSGAGTVQDTQGKFPETRRRGVNYYPTPYYVDPVYGVPYNGYLAPAVRRW